jgi:hypothetical protein
MQRTIRIKRLYSLGDYRNIEFEDIVEDVPAEIAFDPQFVTELNYLQLVGIELAYRKYMTLVQEVPHTQAVEEAVAALEEIRENTMKSLKAIIDGEGD